MTARPGRGGPDGVPARTPGIPASYPVTIRDGIVVLDRTRGVILDLTQADPDPQWRDCLAGCAREFDWPDGTSVEVDRRGCWHASFGGGPYRWSAWALPAVHEMVTRAAKAGR